MAKIFTYVIIMTVMILVMGLFGIGSPSSNKLKIGDPDSFSTNYQITNPFSFLVDNKIALLIGGLAVLGLSIALRSDPMVAVTASVASSFLVLFCADMAAIQRQIFANSSDFPIGGWVFFIIWCPLAIGYLIAMIDWIRGGID